MSTTTISMRCPECNKVYESGKFCPECGTRLVEEPMTTPSAEQEKVVVDIPINDFQQMLDKVKISTLPARESELAPKDAITMNLITSAIQSNSIEHLLDRLPRLAALAQIYLVDEVQYKYYLALAAADPEKLTRMEEDSKVAPEYWRTYWSVIAYLKQDKTSKAEEMLSKLSNYPKYSDDNELLLSAVSAYFTGGEEGRVLATQYLRLLKGCSHPELDQFVDTVYYIINPLLAEERKVKRDKCAFYLDNILNLEALRMRTARTAEAAEDIPSAEDWNTVSTQLKYIVSITKVKNGMLATMTAWNLFGWSISFFETASEHLPITVKDFANKEEAIKLMEQLNEGGLVAELHVVDAETGDEVVDVAIEEKSAPKPESAKSTVMIPAHSTNTKSAFEQGQDIANQISTFKKSTNPNSKENYEIVMLKAGPYRQQMERFLVSNGILSPMMARNMLQKTPFKLVSGLTQAEAEELKRKINELGGKVLVANR